MLKTSDKEPQQWKTAFHDVLGSNGKILTQLIPNLEMIIGPQPEVPQLGGQEAQNRFNYVFQRFIRALTWEIFIFKYRKSKNLSQRVLI